MKAAALALLISMTAAAQNKPTLAYYPLDVKRPDLTAEQRVKVETEFLRALTSAKVAVADPVENERAVAALMRRDCELEDACLERLAELGKKTLYAIYASVDVDVRKQISGKARVVRIDGQKVREAVVAPRPVGELPPVGAISAVVVELMTKLDLGALPSSLPSVTAAPVAEKPRPPEVIAPVSSGPPAAACGAALVVGLAAMVTGAGVWAVGSAGASGALNPSTGDVRADRLGAFQQGRTMQVGGAATLGIGVAVALAGAGMFMARGAPNASVTPVAGGAVVSWGGTW